MPYATNPNDGVRIYYEVEGEGPPVALLHGLTQTRSAWRRNGVVGALRDRYQLVLIDARGHGESDKPQTPAAHGGHSAMAGDTVAVLDGLEIEQVHALGYSMGSVTGFALGLDHPDRLRLLALGGGAYRQAERFRTALIEILEQGPSALIAFFEASYGEVPLERRIEIEQLDYGAQIAAMQAILAEPLPLVEFRNLRIPCLLFSGERDIVAYDQSQEVACAIPGAELHILPDLDHNQVAANGWTQMLPKITAFLERVEIERR